MQLLTRESQEYITVATALAEEFALTAAKRDQAGGTAKAQRDRLRQSGLLKLMVPEEYGGLGATWTTTLNVVREFAKVDASIAHLFGYQHLQVITPHLYGTPEQKEKYYSGTAKHNWFWGNALNPRDSRLKLTVSEGQFRLNGTKSFCSGAKDSDMLTVAATPPYGFKSVVVAIPTSRDGVIIHDDWDNIGQRQTDSGSVTFEQVLVETDEVLLAPQSVSSPFCTMRVYTSHLVRANIFLGIALGAFAAAKQYTTTTTKPWLTSGVDQATADPYILQTYGSLWVDLSAATNLVDRAGEKLQVAWEKDTNLTSEEVEACAIAISAACVMAAQVGLDVTNKLFEVMGTRSTATHYGFDRYWRNLRTLTLHDPIDYKLREIGNWVLNQEFSPGTH